MRTVPLLLLLLLLLLPARVRGEAIEISAPGRQTIPLALPACLPLDGSSRPDLGQAFVATLQGDLDETALFAFIDPAAFLADAARTGLSGNEVDFAQWRLLGAEFLLKSAYRWDGKELLVEARLYEVASGRLAAGRRYRGGEGDAPAMAHAFADQILRGVGGREGSFAGQIFFVGHRNGSKELYQMASDGSNVRQLTEHRSLILNPDVSPVARELIFTSYRSGNPDLYRKETYSGREMRLSARKGVNIAARYAPDGRHIVATLSFEGNSELYLLAPDGTVQQRLTNDRGIDVDPAWSPDGRQIVFVSDRLGTPQLFVLDLASGETRRLSYVGKYYASPVWSPDGERIVFSRLDEGRFELCSIRPDGRDERRLTDGPGNKEHPRFSPDGRFLLFTGDHGGKRIYRMRSDGSGVKRISPEGLAASHAVWSGRW